MAVTDERTKSQKAGSEETSKSAAQTRRSKALFKNDRNSNPVYMTLALLAAMGVNRGVRFLDSFGKVMFGAPYDRQTR
jgi:hypothetical protein